MRVNRSGVAALAAVMAVAAWVVVGAGQTAGQKQPARTAQPAVAQRATAAPGAVPGTGAQSRLPLEPLGVRGEAIWPAFEGWGPDKKDGTSLILIGYNNRNTAQEIDIPVGPGNHIEPGGPDYGQPTHFLTSRQWGRRREDRASQWRRPEGGHAGRDGSVVRSTWRVLAARAGQ